ncbi:hypothetical protein SAMN04488030_0631 [Aliiroseovarius halocynthiae]|nr:hypothetical protein SAMN04488030_0631 [Aliiroseovarius halocynthiae]
MAVQMTTPMMIQAWLKPAVDLSDVKRHQSAPNWARFFLCVFAKKLPNLPQAGFKGLKFYDRLEGP